MHEMQCADAAAAFMPFFLTIRDGGGFGGEEEHYGLKVFLKESAQYRK